MSTAATVQSASICTAERPLVIGAFLFDDFQSLDLYGPLGIFSILRERVRIVTLAAAPGSVRASHGPATVADRAFADPGPLDVLLVPGGQGTRREVDNAALLESLRRLAETTPLVASVCTGSALLARAGLLDGHRATSNKRAFPWAVSQGPGVHWVPEARWVEDGKFFTSSGVAAGIDLALAIVARLFDRDTAIGIAQAAEYEWRENSARDPFARVHGLVS